MWLVEKYGVEGFKEAVTKEVESYDRGVTVEDEQPLPEGDFERRDLVGIYKQPQEGKSRVGVMVPAGRLSVKECRQIADLADKYSGGEVRLTVEQNFILPNGDDNMKVFSGFWPSMGPVSVGLARMWDGRRLGGGGTRHPWHGGIEIVAACSAEAGND
jgi:hypothetical protein